MLNLRVAMGGALLVAGALGSACNSTPVAGVCCTTADECSRIGADEPRACPGGFVCTELVCEPAMCFANADCAAETPVCDQGTRSCRACRRDAECESDVCDPESGQCVAESSVIYASSTGTDATTCTRQSPCSVSRALVVAGAQPDSAVVRLLPGTYNQPLALSGGRVTLAADDATLLGAPGSTTLAIDGDANVAIHGLTVDLTRGSASCQGAAAQPSLTLRDVTISSPSTNHLTISECVVNIMASTLRASHPELGNAIIDVRPGGHLEADAVHVIGLDPSSPTVIRVQSEPNNYRPTTATFSNSIFENALTALNAPSGYDYRLSIKFSTLIQLGRHFEAFSCLNEDISIENSIIYGLGDANGDAIKYSRCTIEGNLVYPQSDPSSLPPTNIVALPSFVAAEQHDFRLLADSPAVDAARLGALPPPDHDFAATPRPQGTAPDIGAFERVP